MPEPTRKKIEKTFVDHFFKTPISPGLTELTTKFGNKRMKKKYFKKEMKRLSGVKKFLNSKEGSLKENIKKSKRKIEKTGNPRLTRKKGKLKKNITTKINKKIELKKFNEVEFLEKSSLLSSSISRRESVDTLDQNNQSKDSIALSCDTRGGTSLTHSSNNNSTRKTKLSRNEKITDYFEVRRSSRIPIVDKKIEAQKEMEYKIINRIEDGLIISDEGVKGKGVRSLKFISKGDFVCEYYGELITSSEALEREKMYSKDTKIGCYMYYFKYNKKSYWFTLDATRINSIGRYINHSIKKANLIPKCMDVCGTPTLCFYSKRNIIIDEELLYDYGDRSKESILEHPWLKK